jgi:hypothetical protein
LISSLWYIFKVHPLCRVRKCGAMGVGKRGEWERTRIPPEFRCSGRLDAGGLLHAFHVAPVGVWLCEATDPTWWVVDKGQPQVPGSQPPASHAGYCRGAENRQIGAPGQPLAPGMKKGKGRRRGGAGWFPLEQESFVRSVTGAQDGLLAGS